MRAGGLSNSFSTERVSISTFISHVRQSVASRANGIAIMCLIRCIIQEIDARVGSEVCFLQALEFTPDSSVRLLQGAGLADTATFSTPAS